MTKLPADTTEPVDIVAVAPNHTAANQNAVTTLESSSPDVVPRIAFRLADQRSRVNAAGDEWMYELKDTEDQISYAAVAAVFNRIVAGEAEEANRLWKRLRVQSSLAVGVPKDRKTSTAVLDSESETITAFTDVTSDCRSDCDASKDPNASGECVSEMAALSIQRMLARGHLWAQS